MRTTTRWITAAAAALATACGGSDATRATEAPTEQQARAERAERAQPRPTDAQIAEAVRWELTADPAIDVDRVHVRVEDGIVTLDGTAPHLLMVDRAVERAEMVWGVRGVVELLDVPSTDRPDAAIAGDARNALLIDPATESREIRVRVEDGVATLRGEVESFAEKRLAERTVRAVHGVRGVENELEVRYPEARSDLQIRADVLGALRVDRWVDDWMLHVEVDDGEVTLSGAQPSAAARRRAIDAAWVMGVRDVDAEQIAVQPYMAREMRMPPSGYQMPSDEEIHEAVTAAIRRDPRVSMHEIDVDYDRFTSNVTLQGIVDTLAAYEAAEETAMTVRGVEQVDNELIVEAAPQERAEVQRRIAERFRAHPAIQDAAIVVDVQDDRVVLTGSVDALYTRIAAEDAVESVPGVREVDNRIEAPSPVPPGGLDDYALRQRIHNRLVFHPYVDASSIQVDVVDGAATLLGTVYDARAEQAAIAAARQAGAVTVLDGLEIATGRNRRVP